MSKTKSIIQYIWHKWLPFLVADSHDPTLPDGLWHVPQGIIAALIATWYFGVSVFLVTLIVAVFFFLREAFQEYRMVRRLRYRYKHWYNATRWSQNRHQDWIFPTVSCFITGVWV